MRSIPPDIVAAAKKSQEETCIPASVSIAQWALESGWGAHSPGNNPFGMKPRKGKDDPQQMLMTTEYVNGKAVKVPQPFRKFASIADAFVAHAQLLSTAPVYATAYAILPKHACPDFETIQRFILAMAGKYATDPLYASKLIATIKSNNLNQFDAG